MCKDGKERIFLNIFVGKGKNLQPLATGRIPTSFLVPQKEERKDGENYFIGDLQTYQSQPNAPTPEQVAAAPSVSPLDDLPF